MRSLQPDICDAIAAEEGANDCAAGADHHRWGNWHRDDCGETMECVECGLEVFAEPTHGADGVS